MHSSYYDSNALGTAIRAAPYVGSSTNTPDGLRAMLDEQFTPSVGDRPDIINVGVVITDGITDVNPDLLDDYAQSAHVCISYDRQKFFFLFIIVF